MLLGLLNWKMWTCQILYITGLVVNLSTCDSCTILYDVVQALKRFLWEYWCLTCQIGQVDIELKSYLVVKLMVYWSVRIDWLILFHFQSRESQIAMPDHTVNICHDWICRSSKSSNSNKRQLSRRYRGPRWLISWRKWWGGWGGQQWWVANVVILCHHTYYDLVGTLGGSWL